MQCAISLISDGISLLLRNYILHSLWIDSVVQSTLTEWMSRCSLGTKETTEAKISEFNNSFCCYEHIGRLNIYKCSRERFVPIHQSARRYPSIYRNDIQWKIHTHTHTHTLWHNVQFSPLCIIRLECICSRALQTCMKYFHIVLSGISLCCLLKCCK